MNTSINLIKCLLSLVGFALFTGYFTAEANGGFTPENIALGAGSGALFAAAVWVATFLFPKTTPRQLNTLSLGLFFGALFGYALTFALSSGYQLLFPNNLVHLSPLFTASLYLASLFIGITVTAYGEKELHLSIPLVRLDPTVQKKRDILADLSILQDARILDLAQSGLLDQLIVIPRFVVKELQELVETGDESAKIKARRTLEVINKLESIPSLQLKFTDADFGATENTTKMISLARMIDADLLTADISRVEQALIEGVRIINIHNLSNALKPLTHSGETLTIKVQRYGKEPRQGVGYLDDGTMVVINGGADFIGETIKTQVLSVKHTSSGRMIFCNAVDEDDIPYRSPEHSISDKADRPFRSPYTL